MDQQAFLASQIVQDAVIRNVEIIGEAANNILRLDSEFGTRHPGMLLKAYLLNPAELPIPPVGRRE
jgi:hypothetical protein